MLLARRVRNPWDNEMNRADCALSNPVQTQAQPRSYNDTYSRLVTFASQDVDCASPTTVTNYSLLYCRLQCRDRNLQEHQIQCLGCRWTR